MISIIFICWFFPIKISSHNTNNCVYFWISKIILLLRECQNIIHYFRSADQLAIDDEVLVQGNGEVIAEKVLNVSHSIMQGNHIFYNTYLNVLNHIKRHNFNYFFLQILWFEKS